MVYLSDQRKFVPNFVKKTELLYELLQKNVVFEWGKVGDLVLEKIKHAFEEYVVLKHPNFEKDFVMHVEQE